MRPSAITRAFYGVAIATGAAFLLIVWLILIINQKKI